MSSNARKTSTAKPPAKKAGAKPTGSAAASKAEAPPKAEPAICAIAHGPHLPSEEAEKRAAQVEALKRLEVLTQDEYDCLRKAYLDRL